MRLAVAASKLQKYTNRIKHNKNNCLFETNHKAFCDSLCTTSQTVEDTHTQEAISSFWGKRFGREGTHQEDAPWLVEEVKSVDTVEEGSWKDITTDKLHKTIQKLKDWKIPGTDGVHNYWCKHLPSLHIRLCDALNAVILDPTAPPP
eukprot:8723809-Ditylum_brightwellii.AAC.1